MRLRVGIWSMSVVCVCMEVSVSMGLGCLSVSVWMYGCWRCEMECWCIHMFACVVWWERMLGTRVGIRCCGVSVFMCVVWVGVRGVNWGVYLYVCPWSSVNFGIWMCGTINF